MNRDVHPGFYRGLFFTYQKEHALFFKYTTFGYNSSPWAMLDTLSNDDVLGALAETIDCLGVKEEMPCHDLVSLLHKGDTEGCVQQLASRLGLPIRINLSFVPAGFRPDNTDGFRSSALARTDWTGHGVEGITAQVSIPERLPLFGSSSLQGYPIRVRVSENCCAFPHTFIALMAHELSHVLLACLWSPHKDCELHTDLVPIVLGLREIIRRGRKTSESTTSGNIITTHTTTYGYLTDDHFELACAHVNRILADHRRERKRLLGLATRARREAEKARWCLLTFRDYFKHLDLHPPRHMKAEHAQRVVYLHSHDESSAWESSITALCQAEQITAAFADSLDHYTNAAAENMAAQLKALAACLDEASRTRRLIEKDTRILRKYVGLLYRLKRSLAGRNTKSS